MSILKRILVSILCGILLTIFSCIVVTTKSITPSLGSCSGICPDVITTDKEVIEKGWPIPVYESTADVLGIVSTNKDYSLDPTGLLIDLLIYSGVSYVIISLVLRQKSRKQR